MKRTLLAVFVVLPLVSSCAPDYEDSLHLVSDVASGNTLMLNDGVQVQLLGLADTPANAEALQRQAVGQRVQLAFDAGHAPAEPEAGSRLAAYVLAEQGTCLNRLLLQNNPAALATETPPYDSLRAFVAATGQLGLAPATRPVATTDGVATHAVPATTPDNLSDLEPFHRQCT